MGTDRRTVPVSLPEGLVEDLDRLVEEGQFGSRSEAIRYGARLVTQEAMTKRFHDLGQAKASAQVAERLERKDVR